MMHMKHGFGSQVKGQREKRSRIPVAKWHRSQGNSNDCGPYCAMFAANALRDTMIVDGDKLARVLEAPPEVRGTWVPLRIKGWATFPWGLVRALRRLGFGARWRVGVSLRRLLDNLDRDRVTIVLVGEPFRFRDGGYAGWSHYKVLYAWDPGDSLIFVDPAATDEEITSRQDLRAFLRQWTAMGRQIIEIWDACRWAPDR